LSLAGPVNATAPNPVTNREYTETLGRVLGRPTTIPTPLFPLRAVYGSELVDALLTGQRVLPVKLLAAGFEFAHPTLEEGLRALLDRPA
jgi:NAD dependent epimerase/dehydratase family enzyme